MRSSLNKHVIIIFFFFVEAHSSHLLHGMEAYGSRQWIASMAEKCGKQTFMDAQNNLCLFWNHSSITEG